MKNKLLEFGITQSGNWKSISEVKAGRSELFCPWCRSRLIAKKGLIKVHHFSHDGETCRTSTEALKQSLLPTFDTFELLDSDERKYVERLIKYRTHNNVRAWAGMRPAIERLEIMGVINITDQADERLDHAKLLLNKHAGQWLDADGNPSAYLLELFSALSPLCDLESFWKQPRKIGKIELSKSFIASRLDRLTSLQSLDQAQRFWFDAFWKRQAKYAPECLDLMAQKLRVINQQSLYVMRVTGRFPALHAHEFIKVGMTTRSPEERLKEVLSSLKIHGENIEIEVVYVKENAGRLERLLHHHLAKHILPIGTFREFFSIESLVWLEQQFSGCLIEQYLPPPSLNANKKETQ